MIVVSGIARTSPIEPTSVLAISIRTSGSGSRASCAGSG